MISDFLIPIEDIEELLSKIDESEELDFFDLLTLEKIRLLLIIFNNKKTNI